MRLIAYLRHMIITSSSLSSSPSDPSFHTGRVACKIVCACGRVPAQVETQSDNVSIPFESLILSIYALRFSFIACFRMYEPSFSRKQSHQLTIVSIFSSQMLPLTTIIFISLNSLSPMTWFLHLFCFLFFSRRKQLPIFQVPASLSLCCILLNFPPLICLSVLFSHKPQISITQNSTGFSRGGAHHSCFLFLNVIVFT